MIRRLLLAALLALPAGPAAGQTLVLVSDINGRYGSTSYSPRVSRALDTIVALEPAAVVAVGDVVAGQRQPQLDSPALDRMWAAFDATVAAPLGAAGIPLAITAGNHDASGFAAYAPERERYEAYWTGRNPGFELLAGSQWPWRYAARVGDVLLLTFHATVPGALPAAERRFVADMLARHAEEAAATVVFGHLPLWPFTRGREREILDDPELLSLLHHHGVDVYASGHHHAFFAGTDAAGMLHLSVGALGGNVRPLAAGGETQAHSFAVLQFVDGDYCLRAPKSPDFADHIATDSLPERVEGPLGRLQRLDFKQRNCPR